MDNIDRLLADAVTGRDHLNAEKLHCLLSLTSEDELQRLYAAAYRVKTDFFGKRVYLRGLVEVSNICAKDCYYCGIRRSNREIERYRMTENDIVRICKWAFEQRYGSVVLQSGENSNPEFIDFIDKAVKAIRSMSEGKLSVTLCVGEQTETAYRRWHDAGAQRYLLRIETSSPRLYSQLHPMDHSFNHRFSCLEILRHTGYQTGTGVMIGLPRQSIEDLVNDLLFFRDQDFDMIGMGPYLPHHGTPLSEHVKDFDVKRQLALALKMIACARLLLKNVNIVATTALQALSFRGREYGILAGANVLMPNITDVCYRHKYQLYDNKPCLDENSRQCRNCLERRMGTIGESIAWDEPGDSLHYHLRCVNIQE